MRFIDDSKIKTESTIRSKKITKGQNSRKTVPPISHPANTAYTVPTGGVFLPFILT